MRTVLAVDPFVSLAAGEQPEMVAVRVERAPFNVQKGNVVYTFPISLALFAAWGTPNAVKERGRLLRDLLRQHPGVASVLDHLAAVPIGSVQPLFVKLSEGEAELISWETLCDSGDAFVALDQRWPIGRISDPTTIQARPPAVMRLPVRMMMVISAIGIPSQWQEWQLCRAAVVEARAAGLPVSLKVLVGDTKLRATIDAEIAAGLSDVEVGHVEKTGNRVLQDIIAWEPNIVHFFCHGVAEGETQWLELATAADLADPGVTSGSVRVLARQLVSMATTLANPWLLTLNCCSSGQGAKELHSMAHQVVSAGFPATVAMVEPVAATDAHEFTRAFYSDIFRGLAQVRTALQATTRAPFECGQAMFAARTAILAAHEDDSDNAPEWALPVLYVRGVEPLQFELDSSSVDAAAAEYRLRAGLIAEWLQSVRDETPPERRRAVMERALAHVPKEFWSDVDGGFGGDPADG
jgi:hypothetical protein